MALWIVANNVRLGTAHVFNAGETIDDTKQSLTPLQAAGVVLWPATDATVAAAALIAQKIRNKKADSFLPSQNVVLAAISNSLLAQLNAHTATITTLRGTPNQSWQKQAADGTAATATAETPIGRVGTAQTLSTIFYVPQATLTGDNTNNATILIQKRTGAGAPSTVATLTTTVANGNWAAFVPVAIPITAGAILAGDVLTISITKGGTGVVVPAGVLETYLP